MVQGLIRLFGTAVIASGDAPVRLPAGIGETIALLVLEHGQLAERRLIASRLREDAGPGEALNALRQSLLRLRRIEERAGVQALVASRDHLMRTGDCLPTDVEMLLARDEVQSEAELAQLLELWRGDLLDGVDATGDFKLWLDTQRSQLRERFVLLLSEGARRIGGPVGRQAQERLNRELAAESPVVPPPRPLAAESVIGRPPREAPIVVPRLAITMPEHGTPPWQQQAEAFLIETTIALQRLRLVDVIAPHSMRRVARQPDLAHLIEADYVVHALLVGSQLDLCLVEGETGIVLATHRIGLATDLVEGGATQLGTILARRLCEAVTVRVQAQQAPTAGRALYAVYLAARRRLQSLDLRQVRRARLDLRQVVNDAPGFAPGWSLLAHATTQEWTLLGRLDTDALRMAETYAREAEARDPTDPQAHRELGRTARFLRDVDEAMHHFHTAQALAPNDADLSADHADTSCHASDFATARRLMDHALALNPIAPDEYRWTAGGIHFFEHDYAGVLAQIGRMGNPEPAARLGAAAAAMEGDLALAGHYRDIVLANHPGFTVAGWMQLMPQREREHAELYAEALRRAGFPAA